MPKGIRVVLIVGQVDFLLFDGAQQAFGIAVLPGLTHLSHADLYMGILKHLDVDCSCILHTLIGVMDLWDAMSQCLLQGGHGQRLIQTPPQMFLDSFY